MDYQVEDGSNVSDEDSIIDRIICERHYVRVRVNTMAIIKNLLIANADLLHHLLSRLSIRNDCVVSSLTDSSGKVDDRRKGKRNKSTIDKT